MRSHKRQQYKHTTQHQNQHKQQRTTVGKTVKYLGVTYASATRGQIRKKKH